ncbi:V-set domain-containing T-cell activation inhibitor 1-like [Maylandia zebra]|uniref:V-set domain-containing T-cell activation inhibitor 1-like n=1 Tax=Maylandia zebra TaxID=106582 RepID=UPI00403CD7E1
MAALLSLSLWWIWLSLSVLRSNASKDKINITAKSGQDFTLTCRAPGKDNAITVVEWSRDDLGTEYVSLYRGRKFVPDHQHPSFKNRVDLQDRQMKDGDVSLILKDVTTTDAGIYECRVFSRGGNRRKRANLKTDPISIINLSVVPSVKKNITAGETVVLPCQAPNTNNNPNTVVEWSRADPGQQYVLKHQHNHTELSPSFKNRVDLQDRQMKDGDVSLILNNVTINDTGTYECRVETNTNRRKRANLETDPINIIYLHVVDPPGQTHTEDGGKKDGGKEDGVSRGHFGLVAGLSVSAMVSVVGGGFLIYRKKQKGLL